MSEATPDLTPARLRELLAAATPGPWQAIHATENCGPYVTAPLWTGDICDLFVKNGEHRFIHNEEFADANATLIALVRPLAERVIELGAERDAKVEKLTEALLRIEREIDDNPDADDALVEIGCLVVKALVDTNQQGAALETPNAE